MIFAYIANVKKRETAIQAIRLLDHTQMVRNHTGAPDVASDSCVSQMFCFAHPFCSLIRNGVINEALNTIKLASIAKSTVREIRQNRFNLQSLNLEHVRVIKDILLRSITKMITTGNLE